jgi:hypothetical protein
MRSLIIVVLCVACTASRPTVQSELAPLPDTLPDDPELLAACQPDWQKPPPSACQEDPTTKATIMRNDDPAFGKITQIIGYDKDESKVTPGTATAIINLATLVIDDASSSACSSQISRFHRGMAHHLLGHWRDAFLDFGAVIKAGPNSPFYKFMGGWIETLAPRLSHQTYIVCTSALEGPSKEMKP